MNIHEYQAKELLELYHVPAPEGITAFSIDESIQAAETLKQKGAGFFVVKAQIHAGGRGKGRTRSSGSKGVVLADTVEEVRLAARSLLGDTLVTEQTGEAGKKVERLYITEGVDIKKEYYAGITLDRTRSRYVVMLSTEGGMDIEKVAEKTPEKIVKEWIEPGLPLQSNQARRLAFALGLSGTPFRKAVTFVTDLYNMFEANDASLVEINPLVLTGNGDMLALDAKINFDDNALFRQPEILKLRDESEEDSLEREAGASGLNYIKLEGNVGCMVNGAGLAMATMDIIKLAGGEPANFLDVGGTANEEAIRNGFRIILKDPDVKVILINIFGGIVRCDRVANGIIEAVNDPEILKKIESIPVIVRLQGTHAREAGERIHQSGLQVIPAVLLKEAAELVARLIGV